MPTDVAMERPQRARWIDVALAVLVIVVGQQEVWAPASGFATRIGPRPLLALTYTVVGVALVWRRRAPLVVMAVVTAVLSLYFAAYGAPEGLANFLAVMFAFYAAGRYGTKRHFWVAAALTAAAITLHELRDPQFVFDGPAVVFWAILVAAGSLGLAFNTRSRQLQAVAARAAALEADREERARAAVIAERARITRELHDIVGHGVSLMVLQVVAAEETLEAGQLEPTRDRLAGLERTARTTLAEMRRLVAVTDTEPEDVPQLAPQPGLSDVPQLVEDVRAAGTDVELHVEGEPLDAPPGLGLAVYRLVQEALTNVIKHAVPADGARVAIAKSAERVTVEVTDVGRGKVGDLRGGRGITGMRERVALYGGILDVGPRPEGGFRVRAWFPVPEAAE